MTASDTASHDAKFREMILYVAKEAQDDPKCGATKLNKILFYADFAAYRKWGRSISGQEYQKLEWGPAPRRLKPEVETLEREKACAWADRDYYGRTLKKLITLREPDLSRFSAEEIDLIRDVVDRLRELNATEVSDLSHEFLGWQAAEYGETIPYETSLVERSRPLTDDEEAYARNVAREYLATAS